MAPLSLLPLTTLLLKVKYTLCLPSVAAAVVAAATALSSDDDVDDGVGGGRWR